MKGIGGHMCSHTGKLYIYVEDKGEQVCTYIWRQVVNTLVLTYVAELHIYKGKHRWANLYICEKAVYVCGNMGSDGWTNV